MAWLSTPAQAAGASSLTPPPGVVGNWDTGTWSAMGSEFPYTGFSGEDDYGDPTKSWKTVPPLTPEYMAKYKKIREAAFAGKNTLDTGNSCAPLSIPFMLGFGMMEILFSPGRITMIYEEDGGIRRIHMDGRKHTTDADPEYNGDSIGHWEGKTLVIDDNNFRDDTYIEVGMPHSDQMHLVERWTQTGKDELTVDLTITDPKALTRPLHQSFQWKRGKDEIVEDYCVGNRDQNIGGATVLIGIDGKPLLGPKH